MAEACKACGEPLRWAKTASGKWMPVEVVTGEPHWIKCPNAKDFRRKPSKVGQARSK